MIICTSFTPVITHSSHCGTTPRVIRISVNATLSRITHNLLLQPPKLPLQSQLHMVIIPLLPSPWLGLDKAQIRAGRMLLPCNDMEDLVLPLSPAKQESKSDLLKHSQFASPVFKASNGQDSHRIYWVSWISISILCDLFKNSFKNIIQFMYLYKAQTSLKVRICKWLFSQRTLISWSLSTELYSRCNFYVVHTFWMYVIDKRC